MHVEALHTTVSIFTGYHKSRGRSSGLQQLSESLNQVAANPGNLEIQKQFRGVYGKFIKTYSLDDDDPRLYPSEHKILEKIGLSAYIGAQLIDNVEEIISQNNMSPSLASSALQELLQRMNQAINYAQGVENAFEKFGIAFDSLAEGEADLGIQIPRGTDNSSMAQLSRHMRDWNKYLKLFQVAVSADASDISVKRISSSDWTFYVGATPLVLKWLAWTLKQLNSVLTELVETRRLLEALAKRIPKAEVLAEAEKDAKSKAENRMREIANELVDNTSSADDAVKNEQKNSIVQVLKFLSREMTIGTSLELRYEPKTEPESGPEDTASEEDAGVAGDPPIITQDIADSIELSRSLIETNNLLSHLSTQDLAPLMLINEAFEGEEVD